MLQEKSLSKIVYSPIINFFTGNQLLITCKQYFFILPKKFKCFQAIFFFTAEEQDALLASGSSNTISNSGSSTRQRKAPTCSKCKKPMRGHHRDGNVLICPGAE